MNDVSRETPPPPPGAAGVFGVSLRLAEQYAALLAGPGIVRGLIGPREVPRLWDRHLLNCALLSSVIPPDVAVADIGSGAGLPGLVLALQRPDVEVTLVEPLLRRTTFLAEAVEQLGLANVEVVRGRAEELHGQREFDVVTSRAVARLSTLAAWSLPLVRTGGIMLAMKGDSARKELAEATPVLERLGGAQAEVLEVKCDHLSFHSTVVRVEVAASRPLTWGSPKSGRSAEGRRRRKKRG